VGQLPARRRLVFTVFVVLRAADRVFSKRVTDKMANYQLMYYNVLWPIGVQAMQIIVCAGWVLYHRYSLTILLSVPTNTRTARGGGLLVADGETRPITRSRPVTTCDPLGPPGTPVGATRRERSSVSALSDRGARCVMRPPTNLRVATVSLLCFRALPLASLASDPARASNASSPGTTGASLPEASRTSAAVL
jgi:hypothetical protein